LAAYDEALQRQPLAANTRRAYRVRVHQYCDYLCSQREDYGNPLQDRHARNYATRDYKVFLKAVKRAKPRTVNLSLAAIDHFMNFSVSVSPRYGVKSCLNKRLAPCGRRIRNGFSVPWNAPRLVAIAPLHSCYSTPAFVSASAWHSISRTCRCRLDEVRS
jgi:hypothetical protein